MKHILAALLALSTASLSFAGPIGGNCEVDQFGHVVCYPVGR